MSASLEVRVPTLDHRVVEFSFRLPPAITAESPRPKAALLARHMPSALFEHPKEGFRGPLELWPNGCLREWSCDTLADFAGEPSETTPPDAVRRALRRLHLRQTGIQDYQVVAFVAWNGVRRAPGS